tara:strand:- start:554 stop:916 length:363 start_codon:yes stop_codon:yes gene_type:complete
MEFPWKEHQVEDKLRMLKKVHYAVKKYLGPEMHHSKPRNPKYIPEFEAYTESVQAELDERKMHCDRSLHQFIKGLIETIHELEKDIATGLARNHFLYKKLDEQEKELNKLRSKYERSPNN